MQGIYPELSYSVRRVPSSDDLFQKVAFVLGTAACLSVRGLDVLEVVGPGLTVLFPGAALHFACALPSSTRLSFQFDRRRSRDAERVLSLYRCLTQLADPS